MVRVARLYYPRLFVSGAVSLALSCQASTSREATRAPAGNHAGELAPASAAQPASKPAPSAQPQDAAAPGTPSPATASNGCPPAGSVKVTRTLRGKATYYGDQFAGRKTASGEPYQPQELTAAHRTLPFGTLVRVRRIDGLQQAVCVRVTDRGPFGNKQRIIDVSKAAARELDMLRAGVIPVVVEVLSQR